jgi:tryptophan halogenase
MLGQGITPTGYDPLVDSLPLPNLRKFMLHVKDVTAKTAAAMPRHEAFIDENCRNGAQATFNEISTRPASSPTLL